MMDIVASLVFVLLVILTLWVIAKGWKQTQKDRRVLTEGTITSMTTRMAYVAKWYVAGPMQMQVWDTQFEFYAEGQRWTGYKFVEGGDLVNKKRGDRIHVYYLPGKPGKNPIVET